MKLANSLKFLVVLLLTALFLTACGGGGGASGGGGGNVSALTVAGKVSLVDAKPSSNASGKPNALVIAGVQLSGLSTSSDYNIDKTHVYVSERTSDAFKTINQILCMMGQTKYDVMLNKGAYTALVDKNLCDTSNADPAAAGQQAQNQSSSANMPAYMTFTVDSSRADNDSAQIVRVWVHQPASDHDSAALIFGKATISEGTSSTNPYGIFTMDFAGFNLPVGPMPNFTGTLKAYRNNSGKVLLDFVSDDNHPDCGGTQISSQAVTLDRMPDGSAGAGVIETVSSGTCGTLHENFYFAYDAADFWRRDLITAGTPSTCLARAKVSESSWSYGLYDANGARVTRNSGFPITYGPSGQYRGWIGYWGSWTDNNAPALYDGETVNKVDYRTNTSTPYTIFQAGGKLKKHSRKLLTLADIKNIPLGYFEQIANSPTGTNYQVVWDGSNFMKTDEMPQNCNGNCMWSKLQPQQPVNISHLNWSNLNFWSQSLGGNAQVQLGTQSTPCTYVTSTSGPGYTDCSLYPPTDASQVVFYKEDIIYPGDTTVPASLACYDNCLKSGFSGIDPNNQFYNTWDPMTGLSTQVTYSFDTTSLLLMDGIYSVVATTTGPMNQWGTQTGALFEPVQANLDLLKCDWNQNQTCGWKAWSNLNVFYTWETGPNNYNQFIGLKSGNSFVSFEAPLQITYVHHQPDNTASDHQFDGNTFMLDYGGFGQLNGIPSYCVNMDTGDIVDCSLSNGSNSIRWVPQFTIPALQADGSLTEVIDSNNVTYFVKPLEIEQRMMKDAAQACSALAGTGFGGYVLPDISIWTDPKIAEPAVTGAPAVIGGVVQ